MKKIYFAAPLFNHAEIQFNLYLTNKIEKLGYKVYLPQRDGIDGIGIDRPPYNQMSREEVARLIFDMDRNNITDSDFFLFILDGRVPDEGGCVEMGMAYEQQQLKGKPKHIIGLHTDTRGAHLGAKFNPMILVPLDKVVNNEEELLEYLKQIYNHD
ncbi:MAG: nucleoside 2-deoxyribosyltransferase domain-containing protein [Patescibacteria group bacterium]